ncbi:hypothetical protein EDD40_2428 [Saccharothrix texasensis]|uniref:Uncharacterized protein n=1 Tax=Saccharothrix texasensis TaxID=103734 RepID=A0A3N1H3P3_9PSEU|nr:hypothetical protein EDD40_2428 [Saccharothrix texasensis]
MPTRTQPVPSVGVGHTTGVQSSLKAPSAGPANTASDTGTRSDSTAGARPAMPSTNAHRRTGTPSCSEAVISTPSLR